MNERYIIATFSNGYCRCDVEEYWIFPADATDIYIDEYLGECIGDYADSYRPLYEDFEDEEDEELYYENCSVDWRDATQEEIDYYGIENFTTA